MCDDICDLVECAYDDGNCVEEDEAEILESLDLEEDPFVGSVLSLGAVGVSGVSAIVGGGFLAGAVGILGGI